MSSFKVILLSTILNFSLSTAYSKTFFSCEFNQFNIGSAKVSGSIDNRKGQLLLSGDAILDNGYSTERVEFNRQIRSNEATLNYSKYTGSTLFHFYSFSVPKSLDALSTPFFKAYITAIREGVGGKQDIELNCVKSLYTDVINSFVSEYRNLLTYDRLIPEHKEMVKPIQDPQDLPKGVLETLKSLKITFSIDWDFDSNNNGSSPYVINFSPTVDENDAMAIIVDQKEIGYIFNITECNVEECYGWDALYIDANGTVIFKSF